MAKLIEVKVPDIGDFKDVEVIEILVKPGDSVEKEASLISLESDKETMEIPSAAAGGAKEIKVKIGDKINEGSVILLLEPAGDAPAVKPEAKPAVAPAKAAAPAASAAAAPAATPAPAPKAKSAAGKADIETEVVVLGAGPGG